MKTVLQNTEKVTNIYGIVLLLDLLCDFKFYTFSFIDPCMTLDKPFEMIFHKSVTYKIRQGLKLYRQ